MPKPRVIYWFRTDLRLHDSPALKAALDLSPECLYPVWTWDPHYVYRSRVGPNRFQFLIDCQNDLSASLTKLNPKSKLFLIREAPQTLFPKLWKAWRISHLVFEKDTDPYARQRDGEVLKLAKQAGVEVIMCTGRTLYDSDRITQLNHGKPTMSITQLQQAGHKLGEIPRPIPPPTTIPDPGETHLDFEQEQPAAEVDVNAEHRSRSNQTYATIAGPNGDFAIPTLEELGLQAATTPHRGGETVALKALDAIIADERYTATFEKPKTAPTAFAPQSTTLLSPHMHFGSLSCREFYWRVQDVVSSYRGRDASHPPVSLTGQLLFRDMYFSAHAAIGGVFGQTEGNAHCRFLPWHLPSKVDADTGLATGAYTVDSALAEAWFVRWKEGRTGFPWIDALMRQLAHEGWIHHLGRHAVACFLTRGGAYVSWERGAAVFERLLIDHEAACNIGNWQWLSCTAFFAQFYRCYSPVAFPKKWDPNGDFVRRYVPELARLDKKFIYEPHKAPAAEQRRAGCFVKGDGAGTGTEEPGRLVYPEPMFDFAERRDVCMEAMKEAYRVGLNGNDPRMRDGSWRPLFQGGIHDRILQHAGPGTENEPGEAIGSDADAVPAVALQRESDGDGSGDDDHSSRARVKTRPKKGAKGGVDGGKGAVDGVADSGAADGGAAGRKRQATLTRSGGLELKKARG